MSSKSVMAEALSVIGSSPVAMLGTNGEKGYPAVKAMIKIEAEGLKRIWFSTNTSSKRAAQLKKDGKACVYFADMKTWKGLMLTGDVKVLEDAASKKRVWREGFEKYYPLGMNDPDYCVLLFTAIRGNYYHNLANTDFEI